MEISFDGLIREHSRTLTVTLECAGNGVGRGSVSTAAWTGVPLGALLQRFDVNSGIKQIRLIGADKGMNSSSRSPVPFMRSIPLEKAMHPDTLLAYRMNGAPLPIEHGYPLRAIVPGWYGMDSVKWLVRIELLNHSDTSYFMAQQYVAARLRTVGSDEFPVTLMRVKSLITHPTKDEILTTGVNIIRGVAWAGENRVARVEVSTNGGQDWHLATLTAEDKYTWAFWSYSWQVQVAGHYLILARATDSQGNAQPISRDILRVDNYELNSVQAVNCQVH